MLLALSSITTSRTIQFLMATMRGMVRVTAKIPEATVLELADLALDTQLIQTVLVLKFSEPKYKTSPIGL